MRHFMDYVQHAFYDTSDWDIDNFYSSLTTSAQELLFFETPRGVRLSLSSLSSPHSATSYDFGGVGFINGSLSYLYSSLALHHPSRGSAVDLRAFFPGYRRVEYVRRPEEAWTTEIWHRGIRVDRKDTLVYGRLFLPRSTLEALYMRRLTPIRQLKVSCVSDSSFNNGGTILALLQQNYGKYSTEYLYSTDSALLGARGLYNFGYDRRNEAAASGEDAIGNHSSTSAEAPKGRLSAGGELYYGLLNKSGGMSAGLRFTTLPRHKGFPYTMTLTLNPLMGNLSSSYAVKAGKNLAMCSQFDFNLYSYESDFRLGCEVWRTPRFVEKKSNNIDITKKKDQDSADFGDPDAAPLNRDDVSGVLKARWEQNWRMGLLWEGRINELLFSFGVNMDMRKPQQVIRSVGAELQFSS